MVDLLVEKSSISEEKNSIKQDTFSKNVRKVYELIEKLFDERTVWIMEIVASVSNSEIIFLPSESDICSYKNKTRAGKKYTYDRGLTWKNETIIIAAKGLLDGPSVLDGEVSRKIMGTIIHEFCHFAIFEIFGHSKPFYNLDKIQISSRDNKLIDLTKLNEKTKKKFEDLVNLYKQKNWNDYSLIKNVFQDCYEKNNSFAEELVVRFAQFNVEHSGFPDKLKLFKDAVPELSKLYTYFVEEQFKTEKEFTKSLRFINDRSFLGDKKSVLHKDYLNQKVKLGLSRLRFVVKTNQALLAMKSIYLMYSEYENFKSTFMFIDISFIKEEEHLKMIKLALRCQKVSYLIIDGHSDLYSKDATIQKLQDLFLSEGSGGIVLILHENQKNFELPETIPSVEKKKFISSDLNEQFIRKTAINFQGSRMIIKNLIPSISSISQYVDKILENNKKISTTLTKDVVSVGNQIVEDFENYVERDFCLKNSNQWSNIDINDKKVISALFKSNCFCVENESGEGKSIESLIMCKRLKKAYKDHWVIHVNLSDYTDPLKTTPKYEKACYNFLSKKIMNFHDVEKEIFDKLVSDGLVIFIFDSFDEICPSLGDKVKNLIAQLMKKNKVCIFTRPFALDKVLENDNTVVIKMTELNDDKRVELIKKLLQSDKKYMKKKEFNKLLIKIKTLVDDNAFKTPLLVTMTTKVVVRHENILTRYQLYENYITYMRGRVSKKSKFAQSDNSGVDKKYFWRFALENVFSYDRNYYVNLSDFKDFLVEFFDRIDLNNIDMIPLQRSGIVIGKYENTYRFMHASIEEFFIAEFVLTYCVRIFNNEKFLNIFCFILKNLGYQFRFNSFMDLLEGSEEIRQNLTKANLNVCNQYLNNYSNNNERINIGPIVDELSKNENDPSKKFLNFFRGLINQTKYINLSTFAKCGVKSSLNYYIPSEEFERIFKNNIFYEKKIEELNQLNLNNVLELEKSMNIISVHTNVMIIELFLDLHKRYLNYENYRLTLLHDSIISLVVNKNIEERTLVLLKTVINDFCQHSKISGAEKLFLNHKSYFTKNPLDILFNLEFENKELIRSFKFLKDIIISNEVLMLVLLQQFSSNFNVVQLILLKKFDNNEDFENIMKDFIDSTITDLLRSKILNDDFLKELCNIVQENSWKKSELEIVFKHFKTNSEVSRFLNFCSFFKKIGNLEALMHVFKETLGDEIFVELLLTYHPTFVQNLPTFDHCDKVLSVLSKCQNFTQQKNNFKLNFILKMNKNISKDEFQKLVEKHKIQL